MFCLRNPARSHSPSQVISLGSEQGQSQWRLIIEARPTCFRISAGTAAALQPVYGRIYSHQSRTLRSVS